MFCMIFIDCLNASCQLRMSWPTTPAMPLPGVVLPVCFLELLEDNGGLVAIGRAKGEELDALVCLEAGGTFRHGFVL